MQMLTDLLAACCAQLSESVESVPGRANARSLSAFTKLGCFETGPQTPNAKTGATSLVTPAGERFNNLSEQPRFYTSMAHHQKVASTLNTFTSGRRVGALRRFTS
jgi:hypothetical protein